MGLHELAHWEASESGGTGGEATSGTEGSGQESPSPSPQEGTPASREDGGDDRVSRANAEAAKYRRELRAVQEELEQLKGKDASEAEKASSRAQKAEQRVSVAEERARSYMVRALGADAGISSSEARADAAMLLNWDSIEDPEDEQQVLKALKNLVKSRPYLTGVTSGGADGGAGGTATGQKSDMNSAIRAAFGRT